MKHASFWLSVFIWFAILVKPRRVWLLHFAKNGGTTLLHQLSLHYIQGSWRYPAYAKYLLTEKVSKHTPWRMHYLLASIMPTTAHFRLVSQVSIETAFEGCESQSSDVMFAFFVRAPLRRYVSGWVDRYHDGALDTQGRFSRLPFENRAFQMFPTPDLLGAALNSSDPAIRKEAEEGMRVIGRAEVLPPADSQAGLLGGLDRVKKCRDSISFVGRTEHFSEDRNRIWYRLQTAGLIKRPTSDTSNSMPKEYDHLNHLGSVAVANLRKWYAEDYKIIRYLADEGLLPAEYPAEVDAKDSPW